MILMRSPGSRKAAYAQALAERDVPCSFEESGDFFHTMEISVVMRPCWRSSTTPARMCR